MEKIEPGLYQHYKGAEYEVISLAQHSETEEWYVVYRPCYGDKGLWVRPLDMFVEDVIMPDGSMRARFLKLK